MPGPAALAVPSAMLAMKRLALQASAYYSPELATAVTSATCAAMLAKWIWKWIPGWIKEDISFRTLFLLNYNEDDREELSHLASVLRSMHRMTSSMEELYEIPQLYAAILAYMQWSGQMKRLQLENLIVEKTLQRDYGYDTAGQSMSLEDVRTPEHQEALEFATWAYHRDASKLSRILQERDFEVVLHDQSTRPGYVAFYVAVSGIRHEIRIGVRGTSTLEDIVTDCCGRAVPFRHDDDKDERGRIEVEAQKSLQIRLSQMEAIHNSDHSEHSEVEVISGHERISIESDDSQGDNHIRCHEGILISAQRMCKKLRPIIRTWAVDAGYRVILCGHSLGGGAAILAALILRAEFSNLSLQVYAFAPPPVLDHDSAIAAAPFVTSFVHNADMIPRCSLFNLTILLQGMKRFHERLVERGINPTGPKTTTAFLRHLLSSQEDGIAAKSNSNDNHTDKTTELNDDLEISEPLSSSTSEAVTSSNSTALLLTMEEWRDAMENGTPNIRRPDHLFVPGRVLLIYSTWETEAKDVSQEHKEPVEDDSPVISRSLLRCVETDGTCPALRMIEADGPRLFTDHVTSSYFEALGKDYYFD